MDVSVVVLECLKEQLCTALAGSAFQRPYISDEALYVIEDDHTRVLKVKLSGSDLVFEIHSEPPLTVDLNDPGAFGHVNKLLDKLFRQYGVHDFACKIELPSCRHEPDDRRVEI